MRLNFFLVMSLTLWIPAFPQGRDGATADPRQPQSRAYVTEPLIPVWVSPSSLTAVEHLGCNAEVIVLGRESSSSYFRISTPKGRVGYVAESYLSSSPVKCVKPPKKKRDWSAFWREAAEGMRQGAQNLLDSETNNVCKDHGGAKSRRTVQISVDENLRGTVYSSTGRLLGDIRGTSTGTATARIATCNDGTEHLY